MTQKKATSPIERLIKLHELKGRNQFEEVTFLSKYLEPHYRSPTLWKCYEALFFELFHEKDLTIHLAKTFSIAAACVILKDDRHFSFERIYQALKELIAANLISIHCSIINLNSLQSFIASLESVRERQRTLDVHQEEVDHVPARSRKSIIRREVISECTELLRSVER